MGYGGEIGAALRQRLAKAGWLLGWVSWIAPLALQRHAFRQRSARRLGFPGSLSCRLRSLLAHKMSDVLPRFHFVASRLRLLAFLAGMLIGSLASQWIENHRGHVHQYLGAPEGQV